MRIPVVTSVAILLAASVAACAGAGAPESPSPSPARDVLDGTSWALLSVADTPVAAGLEATLAFEAGRVSGSGGCNTFNGPGVVTGPDSIEIGPLATTRKACPGEAMAFEATYLSALEGVSTWAVPADAPIGTQLTLSGSGPKLVFGRPGG